MALTEVIAQIDAEIMKLQQARSLLAGTTAPKSRRGRPKGSKNSTSKKATVSGRVKPVRKLKLES